MNFLRTDLVIDDLKRFRKGLEDMYGIDHVEIYTSFRVDDTVSEPTDVKLGFSFQKEGQTHTVSMPYILNEVGEIAIDEQNKVWTLSIDEQEHSTGHRTLGHVFEDVLGFKKN